MNGGILILIRYSGGGGIIDINLREGGRNVLYMMAEKGFTVFVYTQNTIMPLKLLGL